MGSRQYFLRNKMGPALNEDALLPRHGGKRHVMVPQGHLMVKNDSSWTPLKLSAGFGRNARKRRKRLRVRWYEKAGNTFAYNAKAASAG